MPKTKKNATTKNDGETEKIVVKKQRKKWPKNLKN